MDNLTLKKQYTVLDKFELIENSLESIKNLLINLKQKESDWSWYSEEESCTFDIKNNDKWHTLSIQPREWWFYLVLETNIYLIKKFLYFFERKTNKFFKEIENIDDVIKEIELFSSMDEERYLSHFEY